jgi:hypothetical protein
VKDVLILHNNKTGSETGCFKFEINQGLVWRHGDACTKQRATLMNAGASVKPSYVRLWRQSMEQFTREGWAS